MPFVPFVPFVCFCVCASVPLVPYFWPVVPCVCIAVFVSGCGPCFFPPFSLRARCVPQGERCVMQFHPLVACVVCFSYRLSGRHHRNLCHFCVGLFFSGHRSGTHFFLSLSCVCSCHSSHLTVLPSQLTTQYRRSFLVDLPAAALATLYYGEGPFSSDRQDGFSGMKCGRGDGRVARSFCESTSTCLARLVLLSG